MMICFDSVVIREKIKSRESRCSKSLEVIPGHYFHGLYIRGMNSVQSKLLGKPEFLVRNTINDQTSTAAFLQRLVADRITWTKGFAP